ncbi:RagB/SusD family nutrient uptake outer membrane protein [Mucilaginibacter sp. Bleaf8]|uniref:RagB/SusD family nutrient uptake outer membrane protein n=1 Tax=Mucilaginibacter sp. Bleaf8 TaxID=2834430 RepID=UPI001BCDAA26|nr:RagB/SusD family nutrient uptake outer membrane protein [Mucilaginibacter sp. Bleaf8]MBS7562920.1 RagB/SusD family nutrient uptake outer membrane protein [Mucilaginibacter sp. Bleaf8]
MKKNKVLLLMFAACVLAASCKKYLDVVPTELVTEKAVFDNIQNAEKAWAHLYASLNNNDVQFVRGGGTILGACTDECKNHWENVPELAFNSGAWNATSNPLDMWGSAYQYIRSANLFLANIDRTPLPASRLDYYQPRIPQYKAEARFLRANQYFELFRRYGAVPLLNSVLTPTDPAATNTARNSIDEVVGYITSECDAIAEILPLSYPAGSSDYGRITKGAALALKARTLLYAASPLFNGNPMYASVKNADGKQLFPQGYDNNKWLLAANAAKAVLDLNAYSLSNPNPGNPVDNYAQLFFTRNSDEMILPLIMGGNRDFEGNYMPNGRDANAVNGNGKMSVFQELVDSYEMNNGRPIADPQSGYQEDGFWDGTLWDGVRNTPVTKVSNRFKNRDPRFYASIFFQYDVWNYSNNGRPLRFAWFGNNGGAADGWPKPGTNCETGYNWRKWADPQVNLKGGGNANRNFPIIRLAEMYLIYAEAMNEYLAAPNGDVYNAINKVRSRVSMPGLPILTGDNTKEGMRKRIQNERRVEFAFENQRFWDVRRWLIAKTVDNGNMHGLNARPTPAELNSTGFDPNSEAAGVAVFYKVVVDQTRVFLDRHYLMPIPQTELNIDPALVQNYGW